MRVARLGFALVVALSSLWLGCASAQPVVAASAQPGHHRPWAVPLDLPGVPKLHRVAPNFYRSAQPDADGFRALVKRYGIRTVISLRAFHSDEPLVAGLHLRRYDFPMHTWHIEREDVVGALRALRASMKLGPTLVHCEHGADRTGLISALYRIVYQGWDKEAALDELQHGDFGFHDIWINIPAYIRNIDVAELRRELAAAK